MSLPLDLGVFHGFAPVFRGLCGSRFGDQSSDPLDPKMPWTGVSFLGPAFQRKDICTIYERLGFCKCESVLLQSFHLLQWYPPN